MGGIGRNRGGSEVGVKRIGGGERTTAMDKLGDSEESGFFRHFRLA